MDEQKYQSCGSVIKVVKCSKGNQLMEPMYVERKRGINILGYVDLSKVCNVIKYFPELKKILEQKILLSLSRPVQERLIGKMTIL